MKQPILVASVEGGGTSFVVAVAKLTQSEVPQIVERLEVDSSHDQPQKTLQQCAAFLRQHKPRDGYQALGIASFGPVGLDANKPQTYGRILSTSPKASWRNVDLLTPLREACQSNTNDPIPVQIETDVNAPALAEYRLVSDALSSVAYITVGTGVGVGLCINGRPVHGRMHPEGGHVPVQPLTPQDPFPGYSWGDKCPFHGVRTVEGLASSVALTERVEQRAHKKLSRDVLAQLDDDDEIWQHAANAIANLCTTLLLITSVEKIVIGGGILKRNGLIEKIQDRTIELVNGYLDLPTQSMSELITKSSYGDNVGLVGALVLAKHAYEERRIDTVKDVRAQHVADDAAAVAFNMGLVRGILVGAVASCVVMGVLSGRSRR